MSIDVPLPWSCTQNKVVLLLFPCSVARKVFGILLLISLFLLLRCGEHSSIAFLRDTELGSSLFVLVVLVGVVRVLVEILLPRRYSYTAPATEKYQGAITSSQTHERDATIHRAQRAPKENAQTDHGQRAYINPTQGTRTPQPRPTPTTKP